MDNRRRLVIYCRRNHTVTGRQARRILKKAGSVEREGYQALIDAGVWPWRKSDGLSE